MALASQVHPSRLTSSNGPQLNGATQQHLYAVHRCLKQPPYPHDTCRPQYSRAVATYAAQQQHAPAAPQTSYVADIEMDPQRLLGILSSTKNYLQLAAFVNSQQQVFLHSPLCVYAILHAVHLKDTISDDKFGKGNLTTEDKVLQQMETIIYTVDNSSDSVTEWRDESGKEHSIWTEPNSLLAVEAEGWEHRVLPVKKGVRTILQMAFTTTNMKLPAYDANLCRDAYEE